MLKLAKVLWSQKLLIAAAFAEKIDEFMEIADCNDRKVYYYTGHGERTLSFAHPELNEFYIFKTGDGFAKALGVPCDLDKTNQIPQLIVEYVVPDAEEAGYAKAVKLPYYIADNFSAESAGALVVSIIDNNWEAMDAGYRNAVSLSREGVSCFDRDLSKVYIEDMQILDTEYAASLVNLPKFG